MRRSSASLFPAIPDSSVKSTPGHARYSELQETPIKKKSETRTQHSHPDVAETGSNKENDDLDVTAKARNQIMNTKEPEDSIYKALGWDDTDDIDELV